MSSIKSLSVIALSCAISFHSATALYMPQSFAMGYPGDYSETHVTTPSYGNLIECPANHAVSGMCIRGIDNDEGCYSGFPNREYYAAKLQCHCLKFEGCDEDSENDLQWVTSETPITRYIASDDGQDLKCDGDANEAMSALCISDINGDPSCELPNDDDDESLYFAVIGCTTTFDFVRDTTEEAIVFDIEEDAGTKECFSASTEKTELLWFSPSLITEVKIYNSIVDGEDDDEKLTGEFTCQRRYETNWESRYQDYYHLNTNAAAE